MTKRRTPEQFIAFDVETTGLRPWNGDKIFAFVFTDWEGNSKVYRVDHKSKKKNEKHWQILRDFFADPSIVKIAHNYKFELGMLLAHGIEIHPDTVWHDTIIMSQMIQNKCPSHALDFLAEQIFGYPALEKEIKAAAKEGAKIWNQQNPDLPPRDMAYDMVDHDLMNQYQDDDGKRCMLLYRYFIPKLMEDPAMYSNYLDEIDLVKTTVLMEKEGLTLDIKNTRKMIKQMSRELKDLHKEKLKLVGYDLNVNSPKQLSALLFDQLKFKPTHYTDKGNPATSKEALEALEAKYSDNKVFDMIMHIRAWERGVTTLNKYIELADDQGKLHPNIKTNEADTGRQACSEPNLQNVPKKVSVGTRYTTPARNCFKVDPGYVLLLVDYAGIELRLIIDAAGEQEMIHHLNNGGDVHNLGTETVYGDIWLDEPDKSKAKMMRAGVKTLGFGAAYGGGYDSVTKDLVHLTEKQRRQGYNRYCKRFPKIVNFTNDSAREVRAQGFVETAFGRKLTVRKSKAYQGANYKIQGTAGTVLKKAENRINDYCQAIHPDIQMLVPIHDELIIKYPRRLLKDRKEILGNMSELMTYHPEIKVPLEVEWSITTTHWGAKKDLLL